LYDVHYLSDEEFLKRLGVERRFETERRAGWRRVSKWGSVPAAALKPQKSAQRDFNK
jgi:hypothetical protein